MPASSADTESFGVHATGQISSDGTVARSEGCMMGMTFPGLYFMVLDEPLSANQTFMMVEARNLADPMHPLGVFVLDFDDDSFSDFVKAVVVFDPYGGENPTILPADVSLTLFRSPFVEF